MKLRAISGITAREVLVFISGTHSRIISSRQAQRRNYIIVQPPFFLLEIKLHTGRLARSARDTSDGDLNYCPFELCQTKFRRECKYDGQTLSELLTPRSRGAVYPLGSINERFMHKVWRNFKVTAANESGSLLFHYSY